jgi:hypothetical protein
MRFVLFFGLLLTTGALALAADVPALTAEIHLDLRKEGVTAITVNLSRSAGGSLSPVVVVPIPFQLTESSALPNYVLGTKRGATRDFVVMAFPKDKYALSATFEVDPQGLRNRAHVEEYPLGSRLVIPAGLPNTYPEIEDLKRFEGVQVVDNFATVRVRVPAGFVVVDSARRSTLLTAEVVNLRLTNDEFEFLFEPPVSQASANAEEILRAISAALLLILGVLMAPGAIPEQHLARGLIVVGITVVILIGVRWIVALKYGTRLLPVTTDTVIAVIAWPSAWYFRVVRSKARTAGGPAT